MALRDWDIYQNGGFLGCVYREYDTDAYGNPVPPVTITNYPGCDLFPLGSPSGLFMAHDNLSTGLQGKVNLVPSTTGALTRGFPRGIIQASTQQIAQVINHAALPTGPMNWGVTCMQTTASLIGAGECYALMMDSVNYSNVLRLIKMTAGVDFSPGGSQTSSYIILGQTGAHFFQDVGLGNTSTLVLQWLCDPYFLKGTRLTAYYGGPNSSSVVKIFDIVHTGPDAIVTLTPVAEGIYAQGATNHSAVKFKDIISSRQDLPLVNGAIYPPA